jgi:muramoyltetrapeptide carboxypeptidase
MLFNAHYDFPSLHASVISAIFSDNARQKEMLPLIINSLQGEETIFDVTPINEVAKSNNGEIRGLSTGGNLTIMCNLIGTLMHPELSGKILFLEDVNEAPYAVHRHLLHMYNARLLRGLKAVIFGSFTNNNSAATLEVLEHFARNYLAETPCYCANYFGHEDINYPIPLGSITKVTDNNTITITSPFRMVDL